MRVTQNVRISQTTPRTDIDAMAALKLKFNAVGLKGINTSTVKILSQRRK
jgi:hypothetical protein